MLWNAILVFFLVAANGFFVAAEFALVKVRIGEIRMLSKQGSKSATRVNAIMGRLDTYLSACQLGITLASLGLGWVGEPLVARSLEPLFNILGIPHEKTHMIAFPVGFALITFLHITIGEQVPKMLAIKKSHPTALFIAYPLTVFTALLKPFIWVLNVSSNIMLRGIGIVNVSEHGEVPTEDELRLILMESAAGGHVTIRERLIMENVLDLADKVARSHMLPRNEIVFLDNLKPVDENLKLAADAGHSRLPLCEGDLSNVIGILLMKDMFNALAGKEPIQDLKDLSREPCYLPETATLDVVYKEMLKRKMHLALLVDEHGVLSGLITLENALEQLVGPIQDEFDNEEPNFVKVGEGRYELKASYPLGEAARKTGLKIDALVEQSDTIGGFVIDRLNHFPAKGESITVDTIRITVLEAEPTRVIKVLVEPVKSESPVPETKKD